MCVCDKKEKERHYNYYLGLIIKKVTTLIKSSTFAFVSVFKLLMLGPGIYKLLPNDNFTLIDNDIVFSF